MKNDRAVVQLSRTYELENKIIRFDFQGENQENLDGEVLMPIVSKWLNSIETFEDFKKVALNLKNLFRHFKNKQIRIALKKSNNEKWGVSFQNDHLVYLKGNGITYSDNQEGFSLKYDKTHKHFSENLVKTMQDVAFEIGPLDATSHFISDDIKTLYQVYSLFYGQEPIGLTPNFEVQVQLMMFILREICGLDIFHDYNFLPNKEDEVKSSNLESLAKDLISFGYFLASEVNVTLDDALKNKIQMSGLIIRENIDINSKEELNYLLSFLYYEKNTYIYSNDVPITEEKFGPNPKEFVKVISSNLKSLRNKKN